MEKICTCRVGPMPSPNVEMDDVPDFVMDLDDEDEEEEVGEHPPVEGEQFE